MRRLVLFVAMLGFIGLLSDHVAHSQVCVTQFGPTTNGATDLQTFIGRGSGDASASTDGYGEGVEWTGSAVTLESSGGVFSSSAISDPSAGVRIRVVAAGDFDGDGWQDLIIGDRGASSGSVPQYLQLLKNDSSSSTQPTDWGDPSQLLAPVFSKPYAAFGVQYVSCSVAIAAGDFDKDGDLDVARAYCTDSTSANVAVQVFLNPGNGNFSATADWVYHDGTGLGDIRASATGLIATDYNGDGFVDLLLSGSVQGSSGTEGEVQALLNPGCTTPPCTAPFSQATAQVILGGPSASPVVEAIPVGTDGMGSIAYGDFTGDGNPDIVGGGPDLTWLKLWVSDGAGSFNTAINLSPGRSAYAQTLVANDFNLDGKLDLFFAIDAQFATAADDGDGYVMYGDGDSTPLETAAVQIFDNPMGTPDLDGGALINYDNDPQGTLDLFVGDGQSTGNSYHLLINRVSTTIVTCGEIVSAPVDMSTVTPTDFVVESVRISSDIGNNSHLDSQVPCDGTKRCVNFYASNATPANWVLATSCASGPTSDRCVNLNPNEGREVRWKAVLCSANGSSANVPELQSVSTEIDYQPGGQSFRAGVVVHQGSIYAGGLREPGNRGRFFAFDADFNNFDSPTWEASALIDGQGASRTIFTTDSSGTVLIPFDSSAAAAMSPARDGDLRTVLSAASNTEVDNLRTWFVSSRFGDFTTTSLGAINNSTPAVLSAPGLPLYYAFLPASDSGADRTKADSFINSNIDRYELTFFGSKDGALHAFSAVASPEGGTAATAKEKWAFVSREVAANLLADKAAWPTSNPHYPDGSPTLVDYHDASGTFKTALVVGSGDGGESFFALDVTNTVDTTTPYNVIDPIPLWARTIPNPGPAKSKSAVIRTLLPNAQPPSTATAASTQFLAILATGYDAAAPTDGKVVVAVDLETGVEQWRFEAKCPVTSDIVAFETDDTAEPTAPFVEPGGSGELIDGHVDRVVFADNCGYVYKIDPTLRPTAPDLYIPSMSGPVTGANTDPEGNINDALFYAGSDPVVAAGTPDDRPIFGTIAARPDSSTRMTLFFGTGGSEDVDPSLPNNFFAVYADDGTVRTRLYDDASDPAQVGCDPVCKKFYGGVLVTESQVAVTASQDPIASDACDDGASEVLVFSIDDVGSDGQFDQEATSGALDSGSISGIFGGQGAIYITLLDGSIAQMGNPTQATPSASAPGQGVGAGDAYLKGDVIAVSGWRQVLY